MLRDANDILGRTLRARDGRLGHVVDLYIDSSAWTTRYLVVDTGRWLPGRQVLIATAAAQTLDEERDGELHVELTKEQVRNSPDLSMDRPVSRQYEDALVNYYGWEPYWHQAAREQRVPGDYDEDRLRADPFLLSLRDTIEYRVLARDGIVGTLATLMIDTWHVRELIVDTSAWRAEAPIAIPPSEVTAVDVEERAIQLGIDCDAVRSRASRRA